MYRALLVDDSPHAQSMGESLLKAEGCEVVTVSDGLTALVRLYDVDPDVVLLDVDPPRRNGLDICEFVRQHPRHSHTEVVMMAGAMDAVDEFEVFQKGAAAFVRKPLEATAFRLTVRPLLQKAAMAKANSRSATTSERHAGAASQFAVQSNFGSTVEAELVKAAVVVALDAALPEVTEQVTKRVLVALGLGVNPNQRGLFE
jgi:DNA-binding response OmpR family regulator